MRSTPAGHPWKLQDAPNARALSRLPCELYDVVADPYERHNLLRAAGDNATQIELVHRVWTTMERELQGLLDVGSR